MDMSMTSGRGLSRGMATLAIVVLALSASAALSQDRSATRTARTVSGEVGQRKSEGDTAGIASPADRIDNRVQNRIESRLRTRLDRYQNASNSAPTAVEEANQRARKTGVAARR